VADIRDRHQQTPGRFFACAPEVDHFTIDSIVKIARILAIDRDEGHVAQVYPVFEIATSDSVWKLLGLTQSCIRKFHGYIELANCNLDFHAGVVDFPKDFCHSA